MDCREIQEQILESLTQPRWGTNSGELDHHLAECDNCRRFLDFQLQLDLQLSLAISPPSLNPRFRQSVMENLHRESHYIWPDSLPDKAHVAGCLCAIALSIRVLPFSAGSIFLAGLAFTLATYFVQSVVRGALETWEEGQQ